MATGPRFGLRWALGPALLLCNACTVVADVDYSPRLAPDFFFEGEVTFVRVDYADPQASYAAALALELDTPFAMALGTRGSDAEWSREWIRGDVARICEAATLDAAVGEGSLGLARRLRQLDGASGRVCIEDRGATDLLSFEPSRLGAAPPEQAEFLPAESYLFWLSLRGEIEDAYDGQSPYPELQGSGELGSGLLEHYVTSDEVLSEAVGELRASFATR